MTYGQGRHPNRFRVECPADSFRRVLLPGDILICLSCDRAYNVDLQLVGPINQVREVPFSDGPLWPPR